MTSEPRLSEIASHLIQPSGIVSSDFGKVNRIATACGISFDTWQKGVLYLLLSKKENGRYACGEGGLRVVIMPANRQDIHVGYNGVHPVHHARTAHRGMDRAPQQDIRRDIQ